MNLRLKAKIVEHFGTQAAFADFIGEHEAVVSKVVRGRRSLGHESRQRWAKALECKPEELLLEEA